MPTKIDKQIVVTLQVEGIHNWETCNIDSVYYLKYPHRHIFHIELHKRVYHNDRDIEIICLKNSIKEFLGQEPIKFKSKSCEDIAEMLLTEFNATYVKVLEDNENGAIVKI